MSQRSIIKNSRWICFQMHCQKKWVMCGLPELQSEFKACLTIQWDLPQNTKYKEGWGYCSVVECLDLHGSGNCTSFQENKTYFSAWCFIPCSSIVVIIPKATAREFPWVICQASWDEARWHEIKIPEIQGDLTSKTRVLSIVERTRMKAIFV